MLWTSCAADWQTQAESESELDTQFGGCSGAAARLATQGTCKWNLMVNWLPRGMLILCSAAQGVTQQAQRLKRSRIVTVASKKNATEWMDGR
eukprot:276287-Amphidinium_carterae.1